MRVERALRRGPELFLHERSFDDILDRLSLIRRRFDKALLIGRFEDAWRDRLLAYSQAVEVIDADALLTLEPGAYDLCVAASGLDTVEDLPNALLTIRFALGEDALLIGAVPGGDTLPALRAAMRAADEKMGAATAHVHPRIEPAGLTSLLTSAGFSMPVVDVDRVQVTYKGLGDLVRDLRRWARRTCFQPDPGARCRALRLPPLLTGLTPRRATAASRKRSKSFILRAGRLRRRQMDERRLTSSPQELLTRSE
jgi:hypothetical protein